jgi:Tol biopolymer transport system component
VHLVDAGQAQGMLFMAMELMEGGSLDQRLAAGQALNLSTTVGILSQIASALDHAHRQRVIHRDVKPSNILFSHDGRAVLTDFGIAKVAGQSTSLTQTGAIIGTPEYVSPEQAQGIRELDARSDVYSLGVVAYQMLTGRVPFRRENTWATLLAHIKEAPPPPRRWNSQINAAAEQAVLRALAKAPAQRYASAGEFIHALDLARSKSGQPAGLRAALAGAAAVIVLVILLALTMRRSEPATASQPPPAGPLLAFESNQDGNREIYVADPASQQRWRLTSHAAQDFGPAWSPDGQRLAFASDRSGYTDLYVMSRQGQGLVALTQDPAVDSGPAWSPDTQRMAFDSNRSGNNDVWVIDADGAGVRNLTQHPAFDGDPSWSPDGQWIAFESDRAGNFEIYLMPAEGGAARRLTGDSGRDFAPSWSPDGRQIVFECQRQSTEICVVDAATGDVRRLTADAVEDQQPGWLPDGGIIWTRREGAVWNLFVMDANGQDMQPWMATLWSETAPAWTP